MFMKKLTCSIVIKKMIFFVFIGKIHPRFMGIKLVAKINFYFFIMNVYRVKLYVENQRFLARNL